MQDHDVFSHFRPFIGEVPPFRQADYLGTTIRQEFVADLSVSSEPKLETVPIPAVNEEYFEWIDVLESVVSAKGSYTMIELGAGFGRWVVRGGFAAQQFHGSIPCHLIAVEAEPTVFEWLNMHFSDNGLDKKQHSLIHGAVSESSPEVLFYVGGPRGGDFDRPPDRWYGQCLTKSYDMNSEPQPDGEYKGFPVLRHASGWRSIYVPRIRLANLLKDRELVDLIDMDIEGQELSVIQATIDALDSKVKRLHIGTHGKEIESELRRLLSSHGWRCLADYSLFSTNETPWGTVGFQNGVQSWVNSRLE